MPKYEEPPSMTIEGDDKRMVNARWGRSRKRLILTVYKEYVQQVELTPDQVRELASFLAAGPDGP